MSNPHLRAWRRRRAHRRAVEGPALGGLVPAAAVLAAGWMARTALLGFLAAPEALAEGCVGLALRLGLLCCGAMSIASYGALVRGADRAVLDPHPVDPGQLLPALLLQAAAARWTWPLAAALLAWPLLIHGQAPAWGLLLAVCTGGWFAGLMLGFPVYLAAVWAAESPALSTVFELLRGDNPRLQAALIYAPGAVLGLGGLAVYAAASGAGMLLSGRAAGAPLLAAPLVLGAAAWLPTPALARAYYFRTTTLLAEIDAMYAGSEDPEEARRVYLDWLVGYAPPALRGELLKELRHGWRGLRPWITGAWGVGLVGLVAGWSADPAAPVRAAVIAGAGMALAGAVSVRLAATDPRWLDEALPVPPARRLGARALAVFGWLQAAVLLTAASVGIRQGAAAALLRVALPAEALALLLAALGAIASRWRGRGMAAYAAGAALAWAGLAGALGGV